MGRGLLSLFLLACCLLTAVQVSKTASDDPADAKTPHPEGDPRSQRNADAPDGTAAVVDDTVNGTEGVSEATFVKVTQREGEQSQNIDKEGEKGGGGGRKKAVFNSSTLSSLYHCLLI